MHNSKSKSSLSESQKLSENSGLSPVRRSVSKPMDTKGRGDEQKIWYDHLVAVESGGCAPPVYVKEDYGKKPLEKETQGGNAKIRL